MEPIEEIINENFNAKKSNKKGLIIGLIVAVLAIVVALVLVYFLVFNNSKFIFTKVIDNLLTVKTDSYDSIKMSTKIKASIDLKDKTEQAKLAEIEKYAIKSEIQTDSENKKEIINLGLEYDNQSVVDAQIYYNDGEVFAYLEGLFDKYIKIDIDEESKAQLDKIFESATSKENLKNTEKAIAILKDELKAQIKEKGEFEKEKVTIDVGDDEQKVTKTTLILSEKKLYSIASDMCSNLADNDEFIDCFEDETFEDGLKELAKLIDDNETNGKNNVKISLYTKGLLNNELVAVDMQVYVEEGETTVVFSVIEEDKDVYSYSVSGKMSGAKVDLVKGKVEIEKSKDNKKEQSGKVTITAEIFQIGSAKLEVEYSAEYNNGIDKIDTSNSINMNELTEADEQSIMTKLTERPLIGDLIKEMLTTQNQNSIVSGTEFKDNLLTTLDTQIDAQNNITTTQNEVKDEDAGYSVKYSVPEEFEYDADYSYDDMKFYELENDDYSYADATVSIEWYDESEYIQDKINSDYNYYKDEIDYYKNVNLSQIKTLGVGNKTFKYVVLSYESNSEYYKQKSQDVYVWYPLGDEYVFTLELETTGMESTEEILKEFLNITVTELN